MDFTLRAIFWCTCVPLMVGESDCLIIILLLLSSINDFHGKSLQEIYHEGYFIFKTLKKKTVA